MTKKWKIWMPIVLVVVIALGYWWVTSQPSLPSGGNQLTNQELSTDNTGGVLPVATGQFASQINAILADASSEQAVANEDTGEAALVAAASQEVGDLSGVYDENAF